MDVGEAKVAFSMDDLRNGIDLGLVGDVISNVRRDRPEDDAARARHDLEVMTECRARTSTLHRAPSRTHWIVVVNPAEGVDGG